MVFERYLLIAAMLPTCQAGLEMRAGVIGLGNMGSALAAGLLNGNALLPEQLMLANRSLDKAEAFHARYPGVQIAADNHALAKTCDIIFICVSSSQASTVLKDISPVHKSTHAVVVSGGLELANIEALFKGPSSRLMPSVTMEAGRGISLVCHGSNVAPEQMHALESMLSKTSKVKIVPEGQFGALADLTSCGPALISEMMHQFSLAGARHDGIDGSEAWEMVLETLVGTVLTLEKGITVKGMEEKVATKGGITEQGLKVLAKELPVVLDHMMEATTAKRALVHGELSKKV